MNNLNAVPSLGVLLYTLSRASRKVKAKKREKERKKEERKRKEEERVRGRARGYHK